MAHGLYGSVRLAIRSTDLLLHSLVHAGNVAALVAKIAFPRVAGRKAVIRAAVSRVSANWLANWFANRLFNHNRLVAGGWVAVVVARRAIIVAVVVAAIVVAVIVATVAR